MQASEPNISVRLAVSDLSLSRSFYSGVLNLMISRETERNISFGRTLTLSAGLPSNGLKESFLIYIETSDLEGSFRRVRTQQSDVGQIVERPGRRHFRCVDPDGYQLELFERLQERA